MKQAYEKIMSSSIDVVAATSINLFSIISLKPPMNICIYDKWQAANERIIRAG